MSKEAERVFCGIVVLVFFEANFRSTEGTLAESWDVGFGSVRLASEKLGQLGSY